MENEMTFKTNKLFKSLTYYEESENWFFLFADKVYATSCRFWRLIKDDKIKAVSFDHGHQFGFPKPLDLIEKVTQLMIGKTLLEIKVDKFTADLTLILSDNIRIEIFIYSTGYESYDFSIEDKRYIGCGGGELGIVEETGDQKGQTTKIL